MKLKFKATGTGPAAYQINGETINGIDLSPLEHGGAFVGNDATREAGIRAAHRDAQDVLHVTLTQRVIASRLPGRKAHWRGGEDEIDASDYDPEICYVEPTGVSDLIGGIDYRFAWREGVVPGESGWTIEPVEKEDEHA